MPITNERLWMVLTTGGDIRSRLFARAVLISAALLFRHSNRTGVRAELRQKPDRRGTPASPMAPFVPPEHRPWPLPGSTARLGCTRQYTTDREAEFEMHTPASRQIH